MSSIPPPGHDPIMNKANELLDNLKVFVDEHIPQLEAQGHELAQELKAKATALLGPLGKFLGL